MSEQTFTIKNAAEATGKSADQIRRAIRAKKLEATEDPTTGAYRITTSGLLAAGFMLERTPPENATQTPPNDTHQLKARIQTLEAIERELRDRIASLERMNEQLTASLPALMAGNPSGGRWWQKRQNR